ncbi:MAG: DUF4118 domain-containing protein [Pyrinomonadaceae bacterium]|nr:DUF4118 domain-containing protein [Pyrinomonadaceae bacterium]
MLNRRTPQSKLTAYLTAIAIIAFSTFALSLIRDVISPGIAALGYLLLIVIIAVAFESRVAFLSSLLAAFSLNFFFLPPYHTLVISDPENWITLFVFLSVALTVGQLSARANERKAEAERLYSELEAAFETASDAEALRRSEKLKSALLDAVTHDLQTPLTSIMASATMLIEDNIREPGQRLLDRSARGELLEVIHQETERLNTFVQAMVQLAQIESGQQTFRPISTVPEEVVVSVARMAKKLRSSHVLRSNISPDLPKMFVDPRATVEAVFNLVQNAAKYSPPGSTILISAEGNGEMVRFAVEDEGTGIAEDQREAIFQRFYRAEDSKSGLGMGLAIARGIIEGQGGKIWVESGKKGSRFVFELPAAKNGKTEDPGR